MKLPKKDCLKSCWNGIKKMEQSKWERKKKDQKVAISDFFTKLDYTD